MTSALNKRGRTTNSKERTFKRAIYDYLNVQPVDDNIWFVSYKPAMPSPSNENDDFFVTADDYASAVEGVEEPFKLLHVQRYYLLAKKVVDSLETTLFDMYADASYETKGLPGKVKKGVDVSRIFRIDSDDGSLWKPGATTPFSQPFALTYGDRNTDLDKLVKQLQVHPFVVSIGERESTRHYERDTGDQKLQVLFRLPQEMHDLYYQYAVEEEADGSFASLSDHLKAAFGKSMQYVELPEELADPCKLISCFKEDEGDDY